MTQPGPHVFGNFRRGLWVASTSNKTPQELTDKLTHFLPRLRGAIPNLTDIFLPPEATTSHRAQVLGAGFFHSMYDVAHGLSAVAFADSALKRHSAQKAGALELNFEGSGIGGDWNLASYIATSIGRVRQSKPNLPVRCNVVPYKGAYLPIELLNEDGNLFLCVQNYGGNMDALYAGDDVRDEVVAYGVLPHKVTVMHAIACAQKVGGPRAVTLPQVRNRGAFYIDDLLLDAGLI